MVMETLPSGTKLHGRYRVERVLGNGGFGHVYLSIDLQTGQLFAIKEYLVTGAGGKAQLEHESRVLSQLHHPSLPAFQDAFDERGRYYVVLGYIEGRDLTDCIRATRTHSEIVPLERILNWLISICEAVTFLHNQQPPIIHRDIKPDNIRITPDGTAILVDLGNAKATADGARTLLFIRHQGTPGYAPLEQYPGGSGTDSRSDVYALGGTLFFALTGHEPPSVSTRKQSIDQRLPDMPSLQEILQQNPPETAQDPNANKQFRLGINKPSKPAPRHSRHIAQLGTLSPDLLNRLNLIIARAMAMDPWDRYQSVDELSADLQRVRAALPGSRQATSTPPKRRIDPNSTQPDLQFAFDALQDERENPPSIADAPTRFDRPVAPDTLARCPRCQTEVSRAAQFCPRCGSTLNNASPQNIQDNTFVINQPPPAQARPAANAPLPVNVPKEMGNSFSSVKPGTQAPSGTSTSPQFIVRASTPPPTVSKPVAQTVAQQPFVIPGNPKAQPRPGAHVMQPFPSTPVLPPQASNTPQRAGSSTLLRYVVVALVVVIVAIVIILLVHGGKHGGHANAVPLQPAHYSAVEAYDYERNISFCPASTTTHPDSGVWQCHAGIPATTGVTERVAGSRVGSMAHHYRSRLA